MNKREFMQQYVVNRAPNLLDNFSVLQAVQAANLAYRQIEVEVSKDCKTGSKEPTND